MEPIRAIGLMSGTSLDGVDVALIETDGERIAGFGPSACRPYTSLERALLRRALVDAVALADRNARPGVLAEAEAAVTQAHAEAVESFLQENRLGRGETHPDGAKDEDDLCQHQVEQAQLFFERRTAGLNFALNDGQI